MDISLGKKMKYIYVPETVIILGAESQLPDGHCVKFAGSLVTFPC